MQVVGQPVMKKDAMALVTGKPVFTQDVAPADCLVVKVLRSPHANANILSIKTDAAKKVPGIEAVYTWEDVPTQRFTMAGQTYPEPSPYDRQILDQHVRYVGDPVAIVAGENEECVDKALKIIKVQYEVLPAILDFHKAKDNEILVHPEENWKALCPVGADNKRNLVATGTSGYGDVEAVFKDCGRDLSCKSRSAGDDGDFPYLLLYGCLWQTECGEFHTDRFSCTKDPVQCPGNTKIKDPCQQTENRWWIRGKTVGGSGSFPGFCHLEDRKTVYDHLQQTGIPDRIFPTA